LIVRRLAVAVVAIALITAGCSSDGDEVVNLRIGVVAPLTLDPAIASTPMELTLARMVAMPLLQVLPGDTAPVPGIASGVEADPAQQRFIFTIDANARWNDGEAVVAADVVAMIERVRTMPASSLGGLIADVGQIETPDDRTVVMTTTRPMSELPVILSHPGFGLGDARRGTGPFTVVEHLRGGAILERDDETIELVTYRDADAAFAGFRDGEVDLVYAPANIDADLRSAYGPDGFAPYGAISFLGLNQNAPTLADPRMREAVVRAIDAETVVQDAYGAIARSEERFIPAVMIAAPDDVCDAACERDQAFARDLVRDMYPTGGVPPIAVDYDEGDVGAAIAESVVEQLVAVGIPATLRAHDPGTYPQFLGSGQAEVFRFGWIAEHAGAGALLDPLLRSNGVANVFGLRSDAVDAALDDAALAGSETARATAFGVALREALAAWCMRPIATLDSRWVARDVDGVSVGPLGALDPTKLHRAS